MATAAVAESHSLDAATDATAAPAQPSEDVYAAYGGYDAYVQLYYTTLHAAGLEQWLQAGLTEESYYSYAPAATTFTPAEAPQASVVDEYGTAEPAAPSSSYTDAMAADPLGRRPRAIASFGFGGTCCLAPTTAHGLLGVRSRARVLTRMLRLYGQDADAFRFSWAYVTAPPIVRASPQACSCCCSRNGRPSSLPRRARSWSGICPVPLRCAR